MAQDHIPRHRRLDQITTRWLMVSEPCLLMIRYAPAIGKYFHALIRNPDDAAELSQELLLRAIKQGFPNASPSRGRFRDYLKKAVRNAALSYLRRCKPAAIGDLDLSQFTASEDASLERQWLAEWQECVLNKAWESLRNHQQRVSGNLYHTVLRLAAEHPDESSQELACRAAALVGQPVTAQRFRTQLSRARHLFAKLLATEVWHTLEKPTDERLKEEL